jgi:hemerythrin-like domain-containing protein
MDAFELLKNDHKKVSQLFEEIESASGPSKKQVFNQLKSELDVHAHIEEKIFYPALENKEESRDITLEAYEEHKVVKDLLAELASASPGDEWNAKLKVLRENVEHHVEEEEGELFDKAEDVLSDEQIERLGSEMEAEKARQQGTPTEPRAASTKKQPAPAKSRATAKKSQSPSVLKRLARLVGLGDTAASAARKSGGSRKKAAASKKSSGTKKASGSAKGGSKKAAKKTATKTSKKSGAKKTTKRQSSGARKATKKSATTRARKK